MKTLIFILVLFTATVSYAQWGNDGRWQETKCGLCDKRICIWRDAIITYGMSTNIHPISPMGIEVAREIKTTLIICYDCKKEYETKFDVMIAKFIKKTRQKNRNTGLLEYNKQQTKKYRLNQKEKEIIKLKKELEELKTH